jgi:hypothetical protein
MLTGALKETRMGTLVNNDMILIVDDSKFIAQSCSQV